MILHLPLNADISRRNIDVSARAPAILKISDGVVVNVADSR